MEKPLISVVIPVYNASATLEECLNAVYSSNYPNFEVIIVDDCSKDNSLEIAKKYPCKIIKLSQNSGAAAARNQGVKLANGEIVFFIDSDIIINKDTLNILSDDFKDPDISGVVGLLSPNTRYKNFASQYKNLWMHYTYKILPDFVGVSYTSITGFRKNIFLGLNGFDEGYKEANVEDTEFGQRFLTRGYKLYSDKSLQAEHIKYYSLKDVLKLDFKRSFELTMMFLRNIFLKKKQKNYTSVPISFILSVFFSYLGIISILSSFILYKFYLYLGLLFLIITLSLNIHYLLYLKKINGLIFMIKSGLFLISDTLISGAGVLFGLLNFSLGKRY